MKARETIIPNNLLISEILDNMDYYDCFVIQLNGNNNYTIEECAKLFFEKWPAWVNALLKLRHILVIPFGLYPSKEDNVRLTKPNYEFRKNSKVAFFEVLDVNDNNILKVGKDKHLNAWFSLSIVERNGDRELYACTSVKFNNLLGRVYFFIIKPFHKIIVKAQLNRMFTY